MVKSKIFASLKSKPMSLTLQHVLENARAESGGYRDLNFLKYIVESGLLTMEEVYLKRADTNIDEEYYDAKYKKLYLESDRHFYCRAIIQDELLKLGYKTNFSMDVGDMTVLRTNSNYDIVLDDYSAIIDVGLTPARNFFRGLTDFRVKNYLITTYFDDYMDDIVFTSFARSDDLRYKDAINEYVNGHIFDVPLKETNLELNKQML